VAVPTLEPFCQTSWVDPPRILSAIVHARATVIAGAPRGPEKRAQEFRAGRACAEQALRDAGSVDPTVGVSPDRAPVWPEGFVGSITHTSSFACAVAARRGRLRSIGIDSEAVLDEAAVREVLPMVLDPAEARVIDSGERPELATLAFSAKESLYKCLYPCALVFFEFADAELEWVRPASPERGTFGLRLRKALGRVFPCGLRVDGRYVIEGDHVHTAVELLA
jgi:enterobactin synthetase component D